MVHFHRQNLDGTAFSDSSLRAGLGYSDSQNLNSTEKRLIWKAVPLPELCIKLT